jgi:hypothetical protein
MKLKNERKNQGDVNALLKSFSDRTYLSREGRVTMRGFDFPSEATIISEFIAFPKEIANLERQSIVNRAMFEERRRGVVNLANFLKACDLLVTANLAEKRCPYVLWTRLRISQFPSSRRIGFAYLGVRLEIVAEPPEKYRLNQFFLNGLDSINPNEHSTFPVVIARTEARTGLQAGEHVFDALDTLFSFTNLVSADWNIFGGERHVEAKLIPYKYQFLFRDGIHDTSGGQWYDPEFSEEQWDRKPYSFSKFDERLKPIRKALKCLESHPLQPQLTGALKQMHDGMCSQNTTYRLLRFWSALETLFSDNYNTPSDVVISRSLFGEKDRDLAKLKLKYLASVRNEYVHGGKEGEGIYHLVQFLRDFVGLHIRYLIDRGSDFECHAAFLDMASLPHRLEDLAAKQKALVRRKSIIEFGKHDND